MHLHRKKHKPNLSGRARKFKQRSSKLRPVYHRRRDLAISKFSMSLIFGQAFCKPAEH